MTQRFAKRQVLLRWLWLPALLSVLFCIQSTLDRTSASASQDQPPLLAFYYGWFDLETWTSGQTPDQPLEPYRSSDPAVIARHVSQAQQAGIDALVMSWYGPQVAYNQTEPNFKLLLAEAQQRGFKAAIDFETYSPFYATRADVVAGLKYLRDTHAQHPAYFRFNGKPVIFFWQQERFTVSEWQSIREEVDPNHTTLWIADGTDLGYQAYFDGHHLYNVAWADDIAETLTHWRDLVRWYDWFFKVDRYWVATTMPGFDERHLGRDSKNYRDRGTGEFYIESWQAAMATEPDMLIITSFNEWPENSQIEPSQSYGNYYLDLTRALRTGQPLPATPVLPTPTPTPTPGHGSLIGIITDASTGERLAGVQVSVDGQATTSNAQGYYTFEGVTEGLQVVVARHPGYLTAEKPRIVVRDQQVWNSIAMMPGIDPTPTRTPTATSTPTHTSTPTPTNTPPATATALPPTSIPAAGTGSLMGVITDAETEARISGVVISAGGQMVLTNQDGIYRLDGLEPGEHTVSAEHPGYYPASRARLVVLNTVQWNSFSMPPRPTPTPGNTPTATHTPTATATASPTPTATSTSTATATATASTTATVSATATATSTPMTTATPHPGTLTGLVTNAQTGQPLTGVVVNVAGETGQTNQSGIYKIDNIPPGEVSVSINHPGFQPVTQTAYVVSQQTRWHSVALSPQPTATPTSTATPTPQPTPVPSPTTAPGGKLIGLITNAQTGDRLVGVAVSAAEQSAQTDSRGIYIFDSLPAGQQTVSISHPGFQPVAEIATVLAGQTRWHSMALQPVDTPTPVPTATPTASATLTPTPSATPQPPTSTPALDTGSLVGLITNAQTGERLMGVTVTAAGQTVQSNGSGVYIFEALPVGQHWVRAEHPGFEPASRLAYVSANQTRWNSMTLPPVNSPTPTSTLLPNPTATPVATQTPTFTATPSPTSTATPTPTPATVDPCSAILGESYGTLSIVGAPSDRPAAEHADLNLALRGYVLTDAYRGLIDLDGSADYRAPQLPGLFADARTGEFSNVYQVHHWDWATNSRGGPVTDPEVTLAGLAAERGETIHVPVSGYSIGQGYSVLVLYADTQRITLKFTGEDNVINGYTLHIEGICVDPNLRSLYAQMNATGRSRLPALRMGQAFGRAIDAEIGVAIRDNGHFMDPRVRKDWWRGR